MDTTGLATVSVAFGLDGDTVWEVVECGQAERCATMPGGRYPRYIGVGEAIVRVLRDMGGSGEVDAVLREVWRRYVKGGNGERVVMRLFSHPAGRLWSPEAEEALRALEAAGVVERRGRLLRLRVARLAAAGR